MKGLVPLSRPVDERVQQDEVAGSHLLSRNENELDSGLPSSGGFGLGQSLKLEIGLDIIHLFSEIAQVSSPLILLSVI